MNNFSKIHGFTRTQSLVGLSSPTLCPKSCIKAHLSPRQAYFSSIVTEAL